MSIDLKGSEEDQRKFVEFADEIRALVAAGRQLEHDTFVKCEQFQRTRLWERCGCGTLRQALLLCSLGPATVTKFERWRRVKEHAGLQAVRAIDVDAVCLISAYSTSVRDSKALCAAVEARVRAFREENRLGRVAASPQRSYIPKIVEEEAVRLGIEVARRAEPKNWRTVAKRLLAAHVTIRDLPLAPVPLDTIQAMRAISTAAIADCGDVGVVSEPQPASSAKNAKKVGAARHASP